MGWLHQVWKYFGTTQSLSIGAYVALIVTGLTYISQGSERRENRKEQKCSRRFHSYTQFLSKCWLEQDKLNLRIMRISFVFENDSKESENRSESQKSEELRLHYESTIKLRLRASEKFQALVDEWDNLITAGNFTCSSLEIMLEAEDKSPFIESGAIKKANDELGRVKFALHEQIQKISSQITQEIADN